MLSGVHRGPRKPSNAITRTAAPASKTAANSPCRRANRVTAPGTGPVSGRSGGLARSPRSAAPCAVSAIGDTGSPPGRKVTNRDSTWPQPRPAWLRHNPWTRRSPTRPQNALRDRIYRALHQGTEHQRARWPLASARAATGPSADTSPHKSRSATAIATLEGTHPARSARLSTSLPGCWSSTDWGDLRGTWWRGRGSRRRGQRVPPLL